MDQNYPLYIKLTVLWVLVVSTFSTKSAGSCYDAGRKCFHYEKSECLGKDVYKGSQSHTVNGIRCQKWKSKEPHRHSMTHLPNNYCRNPDGEDGPWCYTTNSLIRWEHCFSDCSDDCYDAGHQCFHNERWECKGSDTYKGTKRYTTNGNTCEKWSEFLPHSSNLPNNYCRNPFGFAEPGCYTSTSQDSLKWESCFSDCSGGCYNAANDCFHYEKSNCIGKDAYKGRRNYTINGIPCQDWSSEHPHSHSLNHFPNNYCRNPGGKDGPWCYTTNSLIRWEHCFSQCATGGCYDYGHQCFHYEKPGCKGNDVYDGSRNYTISGAKCEAWEVKKENWHRSFGRMRNNYCRNPDGEPGPWCYTTTPGKRWELCFSNCSDITTPPAAQARTTSTEQKGVTRLPFAQTTTTAGGGKDVATSPAAPETTTSDDDWRTARFVVKKGF